MFVWQSVQFQFPAFHMGLRAHAHLLRAGRRGLHIMKPKFQFLQLNWESFILWGYSQDKSPAIWDPFSIRAPDSWTRPNLTILNKTLVWRLHRSPSMKTSIADLGGFRSLSKGFRYLISQGPGSYPEVAPLTPAQPQHSLCIAVYPPKGTSKSSQTQG